MPGSLDVALVQWEDGFRRLQALCDYPDRYRRSGEVVEAIRDGLRRRLGPGFTTADLLDLYGGGTDWCLDIAFEQAPSDAGSWDSQVVVDAAFQLQLREAVDFAGGRVRERR